MSEPSTARDGDPTTPMPGSRLRSWPTALIVGIVVVSLAVWLFVFRSSTASAELTVENCTTSLTNQNFPPVTNLIPAVVGEGSTAGVAAFHLATGWVSCFSGMGTGSAGIPPRIMDAVVSEPEAVQDGGPNPADVLVLVHHDRGTADVVIDTSSTRSTVLARGSGFEVLEVSTLHWPKWHAPWSGVAVPLGTIQGFSPSGAVTYSAPFTWCPGAMNLYEGVRC